MDVRASMLLAGTFLALTPLTPAQAQVAPSNSQPAPIGPQGSTPVDTRGSTPVDGQVSPAPETAGQPAVADATSQGLADIIVTARKRGRDERLQDIALAASVVSGDALVAANVTNIADVGALVPNVSLQGSSRAGYANFAVRGMGVSGSAPQDEPTVGIIQDGVYWGSNAGAIGETFDLASLEVLRGPQGTLFGRNVTGGAIVVTTHRPEFETSLKVSAGAGNAGLVEGSAVFNLPVIGDTVALRVGGMTRSQDGYFTNLFLNRPMGSDTVQLVRGSVLVKPNNDFDITLIGEYFRRRGDARMIRGIANPGSQPFTAGFVTPSNKFASMSDDNGSGDLDVWSITTEMNLRVGSGTLTSVTGVRDVHAAGRADFDGFPLKSFYSGEDVQQKQVSQELRYATPLASFANVTAGLYYFQSKLNATQWRQLDNRPALTGYRSLLNQDSWAAFGEMDIRPVKWATLTLGARYTKETKEARIAPFGQCLVVPVNTTTVYNTTNCVYGVPGEVNDSDFSPKAALSVKFAEDHTLYGSFTRGFRSGGFALRGVPLVSPYDSERVDAYEVGLKNEFLDNRLRINIAGYVNSFTGLQRTVVSQDPVFGIIQSTFNAADATIKGFEIEAQARPIDGLDLFASYGYVEATYKEFLGIANPEALKFVRVPDVTWNASATYTYLLSSGAAVAARGSVSYTGDYFYDDLNLLLQPHFALVDASLTYTSADERWSASLWGRNLTDKYYGTWGSNLGVRGANIFLGNPRTYGLRLTWKM